MLPFQVAQLRRKTRDLDGSLICLVRAIEAQQMISFQRQNTIITNINNNNTIMAQWPKPFNSMHAFLNAPIFVKLLK
jgi:hypothetical protein